MNCFHNNTFVNSELKAQNNVSSNLSLKKSVKFNTSEYLYPKSTPFPGSIFEYKATDSQEKKL